MTAPIVHQTGSLAGTTEPTPVTWRRIERVYIGDQEQLWQGVDSEGNRYAIVEDGTLLRRWTDAWSDTNDVVTMPEVTA